MRLIRPLSSPRVAATCLLLCVALMALAAWELHASITQAHGLAGRVSDVTKALNASAQFRASVANMVASEQALRLTQDRIFASERDSALREAQVALQQLQGHVARDVPQVQRVAELATRFHVRVASLPWSDTPRGADARWQEFRAEVMAAALAFEASERAALVRLREADRREQQRNLWAVAAASGAFVLLSLAVGAALFLESRQRRQSERRLAEIVEDLPVTVWQRMGGPDPRAEFLYLGRDSLQERGVSPDVLFFAPEAALDNVIPEDQEALARARDQAGRTLLLDHTYRAQVGARVRWINTRARGRVAANGRIRWTGYWSDVTEQKKMEDRLREAIEAAQRANEAKSSFLAVMSHEIRTPLHGLLGLLELLATTQLTIAQRTQLDVAREAGRSLSQLIDDGLDLSRVEAGRLELHPVPASLEAVVRRACQLHQAVALRQGLQLTWSLDPELAPALVFDPVRIGQILNNFLGNAMKFTPRGEVRVTAQRAAAAPGRQRVRLAVTDTGIGIASEVQARIFEPFVQADPGTYGRYGGSGLGLAICRQLAQAMGGEVRMRSTQGLGTEIWLEAEFPLAPVQSLDIELPDAPQPRLATPAPEPRRTPPSVAQAEAEGTLVLVADDHPVSRDVLVGQLAALGHAALAAADGHEALQLWTTHRVALVLCDCHMPGLDGFGLARAIRAREQATPGVRVPILACTGRASHDDRQACLAAGMDDCLFKPVGLEGLARQLARWLRQPGDAALPDAPPSFWPSTIGDPPCTFAPPGAAADQADTLIALRAEFAACHGADLRALEAAVAARDCAQARLLAHRMAGAAAMVGADTLAASCAAVADAARLGHLPSLEVELEELQERSAEHARALRGA